MVLSNAERQQRYRERLKAAARGEQLAEQVYDLMRDVLEIASAKGGYLLDHDTMEPLCVDDYIAKWLHDPKMIKHNGSAAKQLAALIDELAGDELNNAESATIARAQAVVQATGLYAVGTA